MKGKKLNISERKLNKYMFELAKERVRLPDSWKFSYDKDSQSISIYSEDKLGGKHIFPSPADYNSSTGIRIDWLNVLLYDIARHHGADNTINPYASQSGNPRSTIVTASKAYGPFNSRFCIRDSKYANRVENIRKYENKKPVYGYHLLRETEEDLENVISFYNGYIEKVAFPFLEVCQSLQKINDEIINWYPIEDSMNIHFPHAFFMKFLIMGLCNNPNYHATWNALMEKITPEKRESPRVKISLNILQDIDRLVHSKEKERYEQYV